MKQFWRHVFIVFVALFLFFSSVFVYVVSVHLSPEKIAFVNAIFRRGVSDSLSEDYSFDIWNLGSTLEMPFTVDYTREVAVVLNFKNDFPPSGMTYSGRLLVQYYQGNRLVQSKVYSHHDSSVPYPGSETAAIILDTQVLPLHGGSAKHSVIIKVLEADSRFAKYKNSMKVQVRGSFSW